ncbi:MAG: CopG family transcriptional regulator [Pseudomonadota bacterium]
MLTTLDTEMEKRRMDFHKEADRRYAEIVASGKTIPWEAMRTYLEVRASGKKPACPKARKVVR